jgi:hypothetical protein
MDLNRDSFISEEIINYLQSSYQNIYSDTNIIQNYSRYKELLLKQETAKNYINSEEFSIIFTPEDQEELETLNRYFYGNSDGSSNGDGNNLAHTYLSTINTIKDLISQGDNSIKDVVVNLTALLDNPNMSDTAYKKYLNELIIPGILGTSEITSEKSTDNISINKTVVNELSKENQAQYETNLLQKKEKRDEIDQKIRLKKEENKTKLQEEKNKTLEEENKYKDAKKLAAEKLKTENEQVLREDKIKLFEKKKEDIYRDINLKIQKLDEIIRNEIYIESIKKIIKDTTKSERNYKQNEEEDELENDPENKKKIYKIADTTLEDKIKGGDNDDNKSLPPILYEINDTTRQTITLSPNNKTDKLLLLYIRLYNVYINPLNKKLQSSGTVQYNFPEDIILLYNNFKKEYDEFIKQNKEIIKTNEEIQKNKDALAKKTSQKKTGENSIEQSILDLFEQYENLAIKLKDSEKIIIKKSIKGGASKKLYLDDIIIKLEEYLKTITDEDKKSKIESLKSKVDTIINTKVKNIYYYDTFIIELNLTVTRAAQAADAADANKMKKLQLVIDELLTAIEKINELKSKINAEIKNYKIFQDLFILLNTELTKAYNQLKTLKYDLSFNNSANNIIRNIEKLINDDTELKEIFDKFNEIKKILDSDTQDISKNEISEKFKQINNFLKKLKTLKYLNKYKYYLDKINNLLDDIKKLLDNLAKNNDNDNDDDDDDMKKQLEEEIADLQQELNKINGKYTKSTLELKDINAALIKLKEKKDIIEQNIARLEVSSSTKQQDRDRDRDREREREANLANEKEKERQNTKRIDDIEKDKTILEENIKLNENLIDTTENQIKSKQKRLDEINSSKEKEIKQKKIVADLENQSVFISDSTSKLNEYLALVDYLNKIITSIGILKKNLNELILSKLNSQMKENFKFIQKRYIKGLIDFYNFKIISDYSIKLNNLEKLKPQEKQDKKLTDNIESRYDKIKEKYKETFYKELETIIRITDYQKIAEIVIKFLNNLILLLNNDIYIIEDRIDDYQIYLIINLIIILAKYNNKTAIQELVKIYFKLIHNKDKNIDDVLKSIDGKEFKTTKGGYSDNITYDIKQNDKLLIKEIINQPNLLNFLNKELYEPFIQIRPIKNNISKQKISTLIPKCDIENYFLTESDIQNISDEMYSNHIQFKVHKNIFNFKNKEKYISYINTPEINTFFESLDNIYIQDSERRPNLIFIHPEDLNNYKKYFNDNISELTLEYAVNNLLNLKKTLDDNNELIHILIYIIIKFIIEQQLNIKDSLKLDLVYLLYYIIYYLNYYYKYYLYNKYRNNNEFTQEDYSNYDNLIKKITELLTSLSNKFESTSDIYILLQYLIKILNYMLIYVKCTIDNYVTYSLNNNNLFVKYQDKDINYNINKFSGLSGDLKGFQSYLHTSNITINTLNIDNEDIKKYITNMKSLIVNTIHLRYLPYIFAEDKNQILDFNNDNNILPALNNYITILKKDTYGNYINLEYTRLLNIYILNIFIIISIDKSINLKLKNDLLYILFFIKILQSSCADSIIVGVMLKLKQKKYLSFYLTNIKKITSDTEELINKLKENFTEYSYMHTIFNHIIELFPLITKNIKGIVKELKNSELNAILANSEEKILIGGNKDNNIIDIKNTYDLYYSTNTDDLIIELLDVLGTNENVIYFLLIINTSLANFFEDLNQMLIDFYNTDILLSYYYNENEIIYYIFLNYIYNNYKSLLSLSSKDIIINIGKIKTKENYNEIYKKLDVLFKNPEIISKLILFIKSHLEIPDTIRHPAKIKDVEYLLLFIYKYSKKDEKIIKGYDSFLTYIYLNLLNKFNITSKIKIDNLPTFNLYKFTNLRKNYHFELSSNQEQLCIRLMKDIKLLISIISDRYKYIEYKTTIKVINQFELNDEILDYLNIFGTDEIFKNYKQMPIIDLYILNKNLKIDIKIKEPTKQDNIIYNILLLSTFLYKDNNKIPVEIYCKLVRHYFLIRTNKLLNDLTYELIFLMNKRIAKIDIQRNLIKELSSFNIELSELKTFVEPEDRKINIIELLEKLNFINYFKDNIELIIPLLLEFYKNDNKIQYSIQDLLSKQILTEKSQKLLMYGGNSINNADNSEPIVFDKSTSLINSILSTEIIDELEKNIKKIDKLFTDIAKITEIDKEFNKAITLEIIITDKDTVKDTVKFNNYDDYIGNKFNNLSRDLITHCTTIDKELSPHSPESMKYKSQLNNKLTEINKFQKKLKDNYEDKINNIQKEIKTLYKPFEDLIDKIKKQPEIQDYPYVKDIYKLYIKDKDEDEKTNIMYDVNEYFEEYKKNLGDYKSKLDDIIDINTGKIPNLIKNLDDIISSNKQQRNNNNNNRGGNNIIIKKKGGASIEDIETKLAKILEDRAKKINNISKNLKKLKENRKIDNNVEKKLAASDIFDKNGNNIFERLITSYENDINDKTMPDEIAKNLFYNKVKNNNLDPEIELDITLNDKLIFIAIIYSIRFTSLLFCEYLIKNNKITDINKSLFYYLIFYYVIFGSLLLIINIDTFKLRILINYMNLHINTTNIWMHLILMGCFVYLIYLLVLNILGEEKAPIELGDHEKIKLKYKLDLLTIIIYVFICILIFII